MLNLFLLIGQVYGLPSRPQLGTDFFPFFRPTCMKNSIGNSFEPFLIFKISSKSSIGNSLNSSKMSIGNKFEQTIRSELDLNKLRKFQLGTLLKSSKLSIRNIIEQMLSDFLLNFYRYCCTFFSRHLIYFHVFFLIETVGLSWVTHWALKVMRMSQRLAL